MRKTTFIGGIVPRQSAQALIEFAFILPAMLIMVMGGIDIGRALVYGVAVQDGAREGARLGATGSASDIDVLNRVIAASAPALSASGTCQPDMSTAQSCSGSPWYFTINVLTDTGACSTANTLCTIAYAKSNCALPTCHISGSQLTVTAIGNVSMLNGIGTAWGLRLFPLTAHGQAIMVVL